MCTLGKTVAWFAPFLVIALNTGMRRGEILSLKWPQIDFGPNTWAIHEPDSGFLVGFHAVQAVVQKILEKPRATLACGSFLTR